MNCKYVFADIETNGLSMTNLKLLQIAAITEDDEQFNIFINPKTELSLSCTNLCGLYYFQGQLYRNGKLIPSSGVYTAVNRFRNWLEGLGKEIILVFHNGFSFDCYVLAKQFQGLKIKVPVNVKKVCDTLPAFRKHLKGPEIANHKLSTLATHFDIECPRAHDALEDSIVLKAICERAVLSLNLDLETLLSAHVREFQYYVDREILRTEARAVKTLLPSRDENVEKHGGENLDL